MCVDDLLVQYGAIMFHMHYMDNLAIPQNMQQ